MQVKLYLKGGEWPGFNIQDKNYGKNQYCANGRYN